ncbi:extracellular solute-binding protein [Cutibacterium equinum]|uniref:Extracellular solute-binding protein n=1 Tax=Cutibacterium equinum TaxID=3016342 RepID=A0ABY7QYB1_9ACTN|nr:extracellular solute-binding protein [Cutibacterium equinum]WCC80023.1 extracellular solute-binding protein [Cutibacterium equinum]
MNLSRRHLLAGGIAGLSMVGASALTGCSTSNEPTDNKGNGDAKKLVLWIWPEGFDKQTLAAVTKANSSYTVRQDVIGGDFKQKLTTTFTAGSGLPDITGVKGEDIAFFRDHANYFADLNTLGAKDLKPTFLDWKWAQATTVDGKQLGIPSDIGPTALFYRADIFEQAKLPSEPDEVAAQITTWEDFIEFGTKLLAAKKDTFLVRNSVGMFGTIWPQSGKGFIDEKKNFIGDQDHIRNAWDLAIKAFKAGIVATIKSNTSDSAAAVNEGRLPADFGASWHLADLMVDAPETKGKWRVCAHPGAAINQGGSFLSIPAGASDPKASFAAIRELLSVESQVREYVHNGNFPVSPKAYDDPKVSGPVEFLGGQHAAEVFGKAAKTVRPLYEDANSGTVSAPFAAQLEQVESSGKDAEAAWKDAVSEAKRIAKQLHLTVK